MLDFVKIVSKPKDGMFKLIPSFKVVRSKDLMIRGNSFYAVWDEPNNKWTTDEFRAIELVDEYTRAEASTLPEGSCIPNFLVDADNGLIDTWHKYCQRQSINNYKQLDDNLMFANDEITRDSYASKQLPYPLHEGDFSAWDRILSVLYSEEERHKIEWCIGSIVSGDSKKLQKFLVLYGSAGTGKSTVLNIVQQLFEGYYTVFEAKVLGNNSNAFALEAFRNNPLVAIQHDGDLSKIEDNTKLNSLVSHEEMTINEKFKSSYTNSFKAFLMMGTNKPVKITDAKSGLIRRLIDVTPTGNKLDSDEYQYLMSQIPFQLSGIAWHCLQIYLEDPDYYNEYVPTEMLGASNDFYNFISDNYKTFSDEVNIALTHAWEIYKTYCEDSNMPYPLSKRAFREELKNYYNDFKDRHTLEDGGRIRSYYVDFLTDKFDGSAYQSRSKIKCGPKEDNQLDMLGLGENKSIFDTSCADCIAQYTNDKGNPISKWDFVISTLNTIDTSKLHFVRVPENHIVIDFDIPDESGEKSLEKNIEAASKFPKTYTELSKSGAGVHLHYIYDGDVEELSRVYDDHIEIKVFTGHSSLRRKLTKCNTLPIATISSGLPLKEERKMVKDSVIKNEKMLRTMIIKNLKKEYHNSTKSSIDFINKLLNDAYDTDVKYDVTELRPSILSFAMGSTNQAENCIKIVNEMKFKSEEPSEYVDAENDGIVFYDVEVFPNLLLINWKFEGEGRKVMRMINPKPSEVERLCNFRLVGFNNRRYDNHILYARMIGYSIEDIYELSQRIVSGSPNVLFGEAYNLSYTDVYDFASAPNKKSLKKWEIELGLKHHELGLPWDQPVPEDMWIKVAEYCDDDVLATEAVYNHLSQDFNTRKILSEIAGKSVNDSTNSLTTSIVFGQNKSPQSEFHYRNLSIPVTPRDLTEGEWKFIETEAKMSMDFTAWNGEKSVLPFFPGYKYEFGKSTYRGIEAGEGGYVYAEPGMYENVALLDVASMHPSTMIDECLFGPKYTKKFKDLVDGRIAIKHKDFELGRTILDGKFGKYMIDDDSLLKDLSTALKTPINSGYGLTSASFLNPFKDPRNMDNIVAKRGALFMIDLKYEVEARGYTVAHIKTDSIKIPNADNEIIDFVFEFGKKYGYTFEHEATYEKMCLVNNSVYIAKYASPEHCDELYGYIPGDNKKKGGKWAPTGTQFAVPYVFKTLFSHEPIVFEDMCETKSVKTAIYLNYNENGTDDLQFVGKVGSFTPVLPGTGGAQCLVERIDKDGSVKYNSVTGTKNHRWTLADNVKEGLNDYKIDKTYFQAIVDDAVSTLAKFGDAEAFME